MSEIKKRHYLVTRVDGATWAQCQELLDVTGITLEDWLEQLVKADIAAFYAEPADPDNEPF